MNSSLLSRQALVAALVAGGALDARAQVIHYVDAHAVGQNDGSSWNDAFRDLQNALGEANAGDQIWVADGVYKPAGPGGDRNATFRLISGVSLYGGFSGNETSLEQRNWSLHQSILSGDLNGDDVVGGAGSSCCSAHEGPSCDDPACEETVCNVLPRCCSRGWDLQCSAFAALLCRICPLAENNGENSVHVVMSNGVAETT